MGSVSCNFSLKKCEERKPDHTVGSRSTVPGVDGDQSRCSAGSLDVTASSKDCLT